MVEGISNSAVFLLVSSKEYEESMNCMREMNYADRKKKHIIHVSTGAGHRLSKLQVAISS
jgi:cobalamin biosynthesis Co2+ chelatase CbiK